MSHTYTPSNTGPITAGYTHPDDLVDDADAASVNGPLEALADDVAHIVSGDTTFSGAKTYEGSMVTLTDDCNITINSDALEVNLNGSNIDISFVYEPTVQIPQSGVVRSIPAFGFVQSTGLLWWPLTATIAVGATYYFPIDLPNRCTLDDVLLRLNPADDALPTTKVRVAITRVALDGTGSSVVATIEDPATGAAYQASHLFEANFGLEIRSDLYSYFLTIMGESGGDTDAVDMLAAPALRYTIDVLDLAR